MSFYRVTETGPISPVSLSDLPDGIASSIKQLLEQANVEVDRDIEAVRACLAKARALLRSEPKENAMGGLAPWQMKRAIQYIKCNLSETIRCEDLAAVCRLSVSHFSKTFRQSFGVTPHAYVQQMRVERSKALLAETNEPLAQIALEVGLADQAHFSRLFRQSTGETPSHWRRTHFAPAE
ncbi:helix-turn-helix transcriptional regulator [Rhizobium herbae]|uniref:Helix-turn-helix transcriptional regulator n=1 Tax=Rhizobium herbae TaxID=508661 RepID=A0ABS7HBS6_9HYPH|nr:AraC family transcriptional regulator [Rhizobium herbae]MBW9064722.1 helix-turn-helix transcriptional regulator [Rhizobium herbae]